ncbi:acyl-CoA-binding protein-like protein [Syncephalis plumigaleata]|nr:acyl-CoA-binding protein-like protein [Syncephalis plumigaleata]
MAEATGNAAFIQAAKDVVTFKSADNNESKLKLYGLFKQATVGDNETARPGLFDPAGKYKWDAWTENKGISQAEAQQKYIDYVEELRTKESS